MAKTRVKHLIVRGGRTACGKVFTDNMDWAAFHQHATCRSCRGERSPFQDLTLKYNRFKGDMARAIKNIGYVSSFVGVPVNYTDLNTVSSELYNWFEREKVRIGVKS